MTAVAPKNLIRSRKLRLDINEINALWNAQLNPAPNTAELKSANSPRKKRPKLSSRKFLGVLIDQVSKHSPIDHHDEDGQANQVSQLDGFFAEQVPSQQRKQSEDENDHQQHCRTATKKEGSNRSPSPQLNVCWSPCHREVKQTNKHISASATVTIPIGGITRVSVTFLGFRIGFASFTHRLTESIGAHSRVWAFDFLTSSWFGSFSDHSSAKRS
ncbi:hypothetical protein [Phaeobacter inhibens]|uniref:hypothetical protein n=1 Tax=Phaeobacter inhibens TaxID=221822 RepID=UPI002490B234|nr:hypothetical protein [Phaeobacter inhibens]